VVDVTRLMVGRLTPNFKRSPAPSAADAALSFSLATAADGGRRTLDLVARGRTEFVAWTDGIRALLGMPMVAPETVTEIKVLIDAKMSGVL
jgi:hypothetical protein